MEREDDYETPMDVEDDTEYQNNYDVDPIDTEDVSEYQNDRDNVTHNVKTESESNIPSEHDISAADKLQVINSISSFF